MLTPELPKKQEELIVLPQDIQVVLLEDNSESLSLILPPIEELQEIEMLKSEQVSVRDKSFATETSLALGYKQELGRLKLKLARFSKSPTFLNRIANLAAAAGDRDEEAEFLMLANKLHADAFFAHKIGDNLVARNLGSQAKRHFAGLNLENDVYANLRLAYFHVHENELIRAAECVARAVEIDPLSFSARLFEGGLRLARRDFEGAIHSFRVAASERPSSSILYGNMAVAYVALGRVEKAFTALKRSVALDPLNANALFLLSDLAFKLRRDDEAIPSLRYFVMLEQKQAGAWARLARACMQIGSPHEAIAALKRQAALGASSAIWNNLGVAYVRIDDRTRALQAFKHAMQFDVRDRDFFLAARNLAQMIVGTAPIDELLDFIESVISFDTELLCRQDPVLSAVYVFYIHALIRQGNDRRIVSTCESILSASNVAEPLVIWVLTSLIGRYALSDATIGKALELINQHRILIERMKNGEFFGRTMLLNNVAFALGESGRTDEAERYMNWIAGTVHHEAYPTATFGLIQLNKGYLERGLELYEEAARLASQDSDRVRIRQKLNLELGRYWLLSDRLKARVFLERVLKAKDGEKALSDRASKELRALSGT